MPDGGPGADGRKAVLSGRFRIVLEMGRRGRIAPALAMVAALIAWLWPIGFGGKMPVGGDVTQFSIGLMAVLRRAILAGRLPLWNDLWGYGFPGVAESQMGVFYPPHLALYGLLPTELAYTVNLVAHTLWGGLGAAWAARRFGVSAWGAALAGLAWAGSGFFLIHLPHHWAYTTASWMPWAWGLGWSILAGERGTRRAWALAVVLTLQVLPGHFQLAFCTELSLLGMGLWALRARPAAGPVVPRGMALLGALVAIAPLAAMQLVPTLRLASLAATRRDFEYLSGFAATPWHLVSYVAPGLFHRSPLWRPVAWNPFHTSPEEHLAYIGLAPLFLALGALQRGWRRDPGTRALAWLAVGSLVLSLGPYVPGFSLYSRLPGFSFFRAPARWGAVTMLALAILAGKGFDALADWPRPGRSLARFLAMAIAAPLVVLLTFELAMASTENPGWPAVARGFDAALRVLPWESDPSFRSFRQVMATARRGMGPRLGAERFRIYALEWGETGLVILGLLALIPLAGRRQSFAAGLLVLTAIDLVALGRHRTLDLGPIRPLTAQSRVLARLAELPRGTRTVDELGNLPMIAAAAPVSAYRTLDLPIMERLTALAHGPLGFSDAEPLVRAALRATGAGVRILGPVKLAEMLKNDSRAARDGHFEAVKDPALASWISGAERVARAAGARATTFALWRPASPPTRAWFIPTNSRVTLHSLVASQGDPSYVLDVLKEAKPLAERTRSPECLDVEVHAAGEGVVLVTQLDYPGWQASWSRSGEVFIENDSTVRVFGGWQGVLVPGPGDWTLRLQYRDDDVRFGLIVSAMAWTTGVLAFLRTRRRWSAPAGAIQGEPPPGGATS